MYRPAADAWICGKASIGCVPSLPFRSCRLTDLPTSLGSNALPGSFHPGHLPVSFIHSSPNVSTSRIRVRSILRCSGCAVQRQPQTASRPVPYHMAVYVPSHVPPPALRTACSH